MKGNELMEQAEHAGFVNDPGAAVSPDDFLDEARRKSSKPVNELPVNEEITGIFRGLETSTQPVEEGKEPSKIMLLEGADKIIRCYWTFGLLEWHLTQTGVKVGWSVYVKKLAKKKAKKGGDMWQCEFYARPPKAGVPGKP